MGRIAITAIGESPWDSQGLVRYGLEGWYPCPDSNRGTRFRKP